MSLILCIDVSGPKGLVILSENGNYIDSVCNNDPMQHASFLQPAIDKLLTNNHTQIHQLTAVSLSNGPGSYTGLRVGLASAKGLCFALNIPLIVINSLHLMAFALAQKIDDDKIDTNKGRSLVQYFNEVEAVQKIHSFKGHHICPMLDARRMEVFFALYDDAARPLMQASAGIVDETFLSDWLNTNPILFMGNGSPKWEKICTNPNAVFLPEPPIELAFSYLSYQLYLKKEFTDLVLADPYYSKAFYNAITSRNPK